MKIRLVKAFPHKNCSFFLIKMVGCVNMIFHFDEDIDNHSFMGYLKVRNTGIP